MEENNKTESNRKGNRRKCKETEGRKTTERNKKWTDGFIERKEGRVWKDIWNGNQRQCRKHEQVRWQVTKRFLHQYLHIQTTLSEDTT